MASPYRGRAESRMRTRSEFDQKVLDIRRTARVVAGGRRFSFRATVIIGDRAGQVGVGVGKGAAVAEAVEKGARRARACLVRVPITEAKTIPHEVAAKYSAARVRLAPAREGRGLVVGGPIRMIADLAGIKNMSAKILGRTANKLNNARATMEALKKLKPSTSKRPGGTNETVSSTVGS
ncbi:MAG: 30S ribosomal protein S5 [Candidatus Sungbacteria bacterium]|uniref:Small ribosomal subunit protein uS5 n=1 Tax=Candidatus Sungiibacteriota bacterium TaxID=2750080 RepID=A0A932R1P5_9BACT|nr:30S ribosomal protein S5 [Candidatus Sungbacteria bacterium]